MQIIATGQPCSVHSTAIGAADDRILEKYSQALV